MKTHTFAISLAAALAACSEPTVHSACYSNGPHDSMSDGRIINMCNCVDDKVKAMGLKQKQTGWVITLLKNKQVEEQLTSAEKEQLRSVSLRLSDIEGQCLASAKAR